MYFHWNIFRNSNLLLVRMMISKCMRKFMAYMDYMNLAVRERPLNLITHFTAACID